MSVRVLDLRLGCEVVGVTEPAAAATRSRPACVAQRGVGRPQPAAGPGRREGHDLRHPLVPGAVLGNDPHLEWLARRQVRPGVTVTRREGAGLTGHPLPLAEPADLQLDAVGAQVVVANIPLNAG